VLALGNDIVPVQRIADLIDRPKSGFLKRCFTPVEIRQCQSRANPAVHFAGRWAAKEAVYKALQLRWDRAFSWKEIEIVTTKWGIPEVHLSEKISGGGSIKDRPGDLSGQSALSKKPGAPQLLVSISHTNEYAFAVALAIGPPATEENANDALTDRAIPNRSLENGAIVNKPLTNSALENSARDDENR